MLKARGLNYDKLSGGLTDINLDVEKGEVLVIIGANSCGKSLLLDKLADPDSEYSGSISAYHFQSRSEAEKYRSQIGYLPQSFTPPLHLTGYEYLDIIGALYYLEPNVRTEKIIKLAKEFNCSRGLYTVMERLSLATRQRIGLIATLLAEPPILLWDEPIQYLDNQGQGVALDLLRRHVASNGCAVIATNDLVLAEQIGSYFCLLEEGRVVTKGTLAELAHQAQSKKDLTDIYHRLLRK